MKIDNNNGDFEESSDIAGPVEIIREEVVEVVENPDTPLSSMEEEDQKNEIKTDNSNRYNEDISEQVKAQSVQLSNLADMVESIQSQVKRLQETIRLLKHKKTSSVRKKILVLKVSKQKGRQKEEGT